MPDSSPHKMLRTLHGIPDDHVCVWGESEKLEDITAGDLRGLVEQLEALDTALMRVMERTRYSNNQPNLGLATDVRDIVREARASNPASEPEKVQPWNRSDWPERSGL